MYIYLVLFLCVLLGALAEMLFPKSISKTWGVVFALLVVAFVLRYGQGTDYFGYQFIYDHMDSWRELTSYAGSGIHSEVGWKILCIVSNKLGLSFVSFTVCLSLFESFLLYRFVKLFCPYKLFALFLLFPTFYLTYLCSALRQGLMLVLFLGWLLPLLLKGKTWKYLLGCLVCASIHKVSMVLLAAPLVLRVPQLKTLHGLVIASFAVGIFIAFSGLGAALLPFMPGEAVGYYDPKEVLSFPVIERILTYFIVAIMFHWYRKCHPEEDYTDLINCLKLYAFGTILYGFLCWIKLLSSRAGYPFKVLEIVLICNMLSQKNIRLILCAYLLPFGTLMYFKNMDSYLEQGGYSLSVNAVNFPYVSIFNQRQIFWYRDVNMNLMDE